MRFEVPQFIEIEDKIFGPLTWKQFVYVIGGGGACFIFFVVFPFSVFVIASTPILILTFALAFYKINNRPFANMLESCFQYFSGARLYLWDREEHPPDPKGADAAPVQTYLPPSQSTLASLSRQLEIHKLKR